MCPAVMWICWMIARLLRRRQQEQIAQARHVSRIAAGEADGGHADLARGPQRGDAHCGERPEVEIARNTSRGEPSARTCRSNTCSKP